MFFSNIPCIRRDSTGSGEARRDESKRSMKHECSLTGRGTSRLWFTATAPATNNDSLDQRFNNAGRLARALNSCQRESHHRCVGERLMQAFGAGHQRGAARHHVVYQHDPGWANQGALHRQGPVMFAKSGSILTARTFGNRMDSSKDRRD